MTERRQANTGDNTPTIPSLILHESRDRRDKQDARLHSLRLLSRGALIALLSVGAIAVAASETLAPLILGFVLSLAIALTLVVCFIEVSAIGSWRDGLKIGALLEDFHRPGRPERTVPALQMALINRAKEDYEHNEKVLGRVIAAISAQAAITIAALLTLVLGFGEAVATSI